MPKAMIVTVGGSISPLVYTLNKNRPSYAIFFVSRQTQRQIPQIINRLSFKLEGFEQITTPAPEKLGDCYKALLENLLEKLRQWKVNPKRVIVDYTAGTKTMSAALVLATIDLGCKYGYIGGVERDKDGIGVVIDGKEKMYYSHNPWDKFAVSRKREINILFNTARYDFAIELVKNLMSKISKELRPFYRMWLEIITGYSYWDKFNHKLASRHLNLGYRDLRLYSTSKKQMKTLVRQIERNLLYLKDIKIKDEELVFDLIANAWRRAELEGRYDDAVARLYRALEKLAQVRLKKKFGISTSDVRPNQLPETIRDRFVRKYTNDKDKKIRIPLEASYELLKEKEDRMGKVFFERYQEVRKLLDIRNKSILAHGDSPVDKGSYQRLLNLVIDFCGIEKTKLTVFPNLQL